MATEAQDAEWRDPANWRLHFIYVAARDSRVWVPKHPPGFGWTLNFARPASWLVLALLLLVPIVLAAVLGLRAVRG